jgi:hypothetical protein
MDAFVSLLVFCQALGASIGTFTAVWGEIAYIRAQQDGKIDTAERAHLRIIGHGLRFGMVLMLLSSFGLVVVAYLLHSAEQPALSTSYWTFIALIFLLIGISWALARRHISFALGSAIVFTAWWFLAYLTLGWFPPLSFGAAVAFFVVATVLFYAVLASARFLALRKR